jgi:hypothetical protein
MGYSPTIVIGIKHQADQDELLLHAQFYYIGITETGNPS